MKGSIEIRKINIVDLDTDAIVNAANEALAAGCGVCGAIFRAAGREELQAACDVFGHCDTGDAVITPGFKLKASYVIHAVGPKWLDGEHGEPEKLRNAYKKALELAASNHCRSIGFPLISAGIYAYPVPGAWKEAITACREFLDSAPDGGLRVVFAVLDDKILEIGKEMLRQSEASGYRTAERDDWKHLDMPQNCESFSLDRSFSPDQMAALRRGHIPREMEDKWFWYMEGERLFAHRSWTGYCIYIIEFKEKAPHAVWVNRDPRQYSCQSIDEDLERLNKLLDHWTQPEYDHYSEWISETADMLKKSGK